MERTIKKQAMRMFAPCSNTNDLATWHQISATRYSCALINTTAAKTFSDYSLNLIYSRLIIENALLARGLLITR
jgi:hypothetical protein